MSELSAVPDARLVTIPSRVLPADRSPARVYLARLDPSHCPEPPVRWGTFRARNVPRYTVETYEGHRPSAASTAKKEAVW